MTVERTPSGFTVSAVQVSLGAPVTLNLSSAFGEPVVFTLSSTAWHYGGAAFGADDGSHVSVGSGFSDEVDSNFALTYFGEARTGGSTWLAYDGGLSIGPDAALNIRAVSIIRTMRGRVRAEGDPRLRRRWSRAPSLRRCSRPRRSVYFLCGSQVVRHLPERGIRSPATSPGPRPVFEVVHGSA
jgi:hypothetical protein